MQARAARSLRPDAAPAAARPEPRYEADPDATRRRLGDLEGYLGRAVLNERTFVCPQREHCKASHPGVFHEGQLHHVGRHYDLRADGRPLRIVVVGQEYGHGPAHVGLAERYAMVAEGSGHGRRFTRTGQHGARNPHMRGTTSLLRLLFRRGLGIDHEREFVPLDGGGSAHIFDLFALVNFLLCSAVPAGASPPVEDVATQRFIGAGRGRSTPAMRRNCAPHFRRALEILDPTCVVAQGKSVRGWIGRTFGLPAPGGDPVERLPVNGREAILLSFTHPSAHFPHNWGANERTPYLLDVVAPAVERVLDLHRAAPGGVSP